jgi:conjugative transfer signal peptidase TraF
VVVARLPDGPRRLAARRGYLPSSVPVIKRIAALYGDRVCARGDRLWVNGRLIAARQGADAAGRPLEGWQGCRMLGDEVLLLGDSARSFDSRYFGPIDRTRVIARARLLWAP